MGACPDPGLFCCRSALAGRTLHFASSAGSDVGGDRSSAPDRATLWADSGIVGPGLDRNPQVDGLGAPSGCARALCGNCPAGWTAAPAIHHEKNVQSAYLGIRCYAYRSRSDMAILGSARGAALACSVLCIPSTPKGFSESLATKLSIEPNIRASRFAIGSSRKTICVRLTEAFVVRTMPFKRTPLQAFPAQRVQP